MIYSTFIFHIIMFLNGTKYKSRIILPDQTWVAILTLDVGGLEEHFCSVSWPLNIGLIVGRFLQPGSGGGLDHIAIYHSVHNWEPTIVTENYENIRRLRAAIWSQTINTAYHF